ncbi:VOC family protein [Cerasicoccus maritimus]|uniref:VOC family protein n=1 Tax=Cerasicoccus maritimus TaxID=490089 RepID=UPI002852B827|nr:VOC family protein [Cerasicoccus maritimus]
MKPLSHIIETCLYVDDLAAAEHFYSEVLGLELFSKEAGKFVFYKMTEAMLLIFDPRASDGAAHELPDHGATGPGHICFRMDDAEFPAWREQLAKHGVAVEMEFTWPNGARSLYFRDPAGNSLELAPWRIWDAENAP